ncbi:metallophosphoesterase family protein [Candidatus Woesearchaeota archaeon]|nr:metallophosphoesterase family protein [Candidatus Woesearchaeota archaeon]
MAIAIISDIHGNRPALDSVLEDIRNRKISRVYCLGDIVGYGPSPKECVDKVRDSCEVIIRGNHDDRVGNETSRFSRFAKATSLWTAAILREAEKQKNGFGSYIPWLNHLPLIHQSRGCYFVHGSPLDPLWEYLEPSPYMGLTESRAKQIFSAVEEEKCKVAFVGHTHQQAIFRAPGKVVPFLDYFGGYIPREEETLIVNVGSVGQPREDDKQASYAVMHDDGRIELIKLRYDTAKLLRAKARRVLAQNVLGINRKFINGLKPAGFFLQKIQQGIEDRLMAQNPITSSLIDKLKPLDFEDGG